MEVNRKGIVMKPIASRHFLVLFSLGMGGLAGCGGGDADSGGGTATNAQATDVAGAAAPTVSVAGKPHALVFDWEPVDDARFYRLYENADGHSGFEPVSEALPADQTRYRHEIAAHLTDWVNAQYMVAACDDNGCTESRPISAAEEAVASVGVLEAEGPDERFGAAFVISADGSTLAAGARGENGGAVYVFSRDGEGGWGERVYLEAPNPGDADGFGFSLALSADGETLAVGAPSEDGGGAGVNPAHDDAMRDAGAAYVFRRDATGDWAKADYLKATNPGEGDEFGYALTLSADGRTLAVAAAYEDGSGTGVNPVDDDAAEGAGAVYVFRHGEDAGWSDPVYLKASNTDAHDLFGFSLALSRDGRTLAVSAPWEDGSGAGANPADDNAALQSGAVYVFRREGNAWSGPSYLKASNPDADDNFGGAIHAPFGRSLAISADGNTLAVGAPYEDGSGAGVNPADDDAAQGAGAAYVFTRQTNGAWSDPDYIKASNPGEFDSFGESFGESLALSADGRTLAVGASFEDGSGAGVNPPEDDNARDAGAVYVFTRDDNGDWSGPDYLKASNPRANQLFGFSLNFSKDGRILVVGAPWDDGSGAGVGPAADENATDSGAVYVFRRDAGEAWMDPVYVKASQPDAFDFFGTTAALSDDGRTLVVGTARDPELKPSLSRLRNETLYLY